MPLLSTLEDVKSLIERHAGIKVVGRPSRVHGVEEYHSNCPWCGGTDRFITRPETGWYTCAIRSSGCGRRGDMLDFLREYCDMGMREAFEEIGLDMSDVDFILQERNEERSLARELAPPKQWQEQAATWLHTLQTKQTLLHRSYTHALQYLRAHGLKDETIQRFGLCYMPFFDGWFKRDDPEVWGLDAMNDVVTLYEGIWIPWYQGGKLLKLEVRRLLKVKDKYMEVTGSQEEMLYNVDAIESGKPVVLVESAMCAIAGTQECGDLVTFVATGGAGKGREFVDQLKQASYVLIAMDNDEAGDKAASEWRKLLPQSVRLRPLKKDIGDMVVAGDNVRDWVNDGIAFYEATQKAKSIVVSADPHTQLSRAYISQLRSGKMPDDRPDFGRWNNIIIDIEHLWMDNEKQCRGVQVVGSDHEVRPKWKPEAFESALWHYSKQHNVVELYEPQEVVYAPKSYPTLDIAKVMERIQIFRDLGMRISVQSGSLHYDADWHISNNVRKFLDDHAAMIIPWL